MDIHQFEYRAERGSGPRPVPQPLDDLHKASPQGAVPRLVACVDDTDHAEAVSAQAAAIACSLGLQVTFARVIDSPRHFASPADPVEWQMRRRLQRDNLHRFATRDQPETLAESVLLAGAPVEELSEWSRENGATLLALGRRGSNNGKGLGATAQGLLDRAEHSLLLVPPGPPRTGGYRRIMVPIDGSAQGDSVLPIARRIARTHAADLVLVHVVPRLEVVGAGRAPQVENLAMQIDGHNRRNARQHLDNLRSRCVDDGVNVSIVTRGPGDPRATLRDLAAEENADLIVMSSHGNTGLADVACGSVTEYLAGHAPVPVLIVRPNIQCSFGPEPASCRNVSAFRFAG
ncbi:hypothetical protein GRI44_00340 [Altererythrobacter confluentis]|uniref:UspA domain-containing protein n=1 Tax=Allopontixanthobacter confluentis TaxID=1849021 RepID=A0A6L7GDL4_9SPHN|nr:universal stress protein [Allopontixanthobacter confluentis]MXP13218.1 hypothetical protein [Allopontixanthobacter confluentis]